MPAYLVSHRDRALSGEASTRSLIAERVSRLWPNARQTDASNWIVTSSGPADEVRDQLTDLLREGDALIVIGAGSEAAWAGWNPPTSIGRCLRHAAGRPPLISGPPHACTPAARRRSACSKPSRAAPEGTRSQVFGRPEQDRAGRSRVFIAHYESGEASSPPLHSHGKGQNGSVIGNRGLGP